MKIDPSSSTDYQVLEGEELNIPAELTMPLSCDWPKNAYVKYVQYNLIGKKE